MNRANKSTLLIGVLAAALLTAGCGRNADPAAALPQAEALIAQGKGGEARILLKKVLVEHPDVSAARVLLAQIALDAGDIKAAQDELAALNRDAFNDVSSQRVRLQVALALGEFDRVLAMLEAPENRVTGKDELLLRSAALRSQGRAADALADLRTARATDPADAAVVVELANALAAIGSLQQAKHELDEYLAHNSAAADVLRLRGELHLRMGAAARAVGDLQAALASAQPTWPEVQRRTTAIVIGEALLAKGDTAAAKAHVEKLQKESGGALGVQLLAARLGLLEGRLGEAIDGLQRVVDAMPDYAAAQYLLVDALLRSGNTVRASDILERRIARAPDDTVARRQLARLRLRQSRPDEVMALLDQPTAPGERRDQESEDLLLTARRAQEQARAAIDALQKQLEQRPQDIAIRAQLARAYIVDGRAERALSLLDNQDAEQVIPARLAAHLALSNQREADRIVKTLVDSSAVEIAVLVAAADVALQAAKRDLAERLIDRALQRDNGHVDALRRRASLDFSAQRYDAARATLNRLLERNVDEVSTRIALARVAEATGDTAEARRLLQAAIDAAPASPEPALMLAQMELRSGDTARVAIILDRLISAAPKNGVAANSAGALLLDAGHLEEARTRFRTALDQDGANADFWFNLGRTQMALSDRAAARESLSQAVQLRPEWLEANMLAIRLHLQSGEAVAARRMAQDLTKRLPDHPLSWLLAGEVSMVEQHYADAERAFARSMVLHPSAIAALREHDARVAGKALRPEQPLLSWLNRQPDDLQARRRLAEFYLQHDPGAAVGQFEYMLQRTPNDVIALNNLAWLLAERDVEQAEALARRALAIRPQDAAVADTLGWVLIAAGKYDEAQSVLEKALLGLPENRSIRFHLALATARGGDPDAARRLLREALDGDVEFPERGAALQLAKELGT